jgi:prephenate dehydrogenase
MNTSKSLSKCNIAVVGLGLMGGSMAMALRSHCSQVLGVDCDAGTVEFAVQRQIVDGGDTRIEAILPGVDLIVLAIPVCEIIDTLSLLPALCPGGAVVMDVGSTKVQIVEAMQGLPPEFDPIGGHPICGKESSGIENASQDLFQKAPFVLSALPRTSERAQAISNELVRAVGGVPILLDAHSHDERLAYTSHLPYLLAAGLTQVLPAEAETLIGPGFLSTSRLAGSSPRIMVDIFDTNREPILKA